MAKKFYAVKRGRVPGIYNDWSSCKEQVLGFKGAEYKKFKSKKEADDFIDGLEVESDILESEEEIANLGDKELIAYVDGSYSLEEEMYSCGVVLLSNKEREDYKEMGSDRSLAEMRNVSGELAGAMMAMDLALEKGYDKLYLHYDYEGIEKWATGSWKTNKEGTRDYKRYYDSIKEDLEVSFIKVAAHAGIKYNEEADRLAKEAFLDI